MRCPATLTTALLCLTAFGFAGPAMAARKYHPNFNREYRADDNVDYRADPNKPNDPGYQLPPQKFSKPDPEILEKGRIRQDEAFKTASEQAIFLELYQMSYGPYGADTGVDIAALKKDTSEAIDECLKGNCTTQQQELVRKALLNYNFGQALKQNVLYNNTSKQNLISYEEPGAHAGDSKKIFESLQNGYSVGGGRKQARQVQLRSGNTVGPYFQLDETHLYRNLDDASRFGPQYVNEYREFLREYSASEQSGLGERPHYKYVKARPTSEDEGGRDVYAPTSGNSPEYRDQALREEIRTEQRNRHIQEIAGDYINNLQQPLVTKEKDAAGLEYFRVSAGNLPTDVGFADPKILQRDKDGKVIYVNGKPTYVGEADKFRMIGQNINQEFKRAAEKKFAELDNASRRPAQNVSGSSLSGPVKPSTPAEMANRVAGATFSQDEFDKFLDDIWPSSARRKEIKQGKP